MILSARQQALIDDFTLIEDAQERLAAVIDRGKKHVAFSAAERTETNRITGCQSQVWLRREVKFEGLCILGDSDSPLVRGLVILTCDFFSGESTPGIISDEHSIDPLELLGLNRNLSATRQNGLAAVRSRICDLARQFAEEKASHQKPANR